MAVHGRGAHPDHTWCELRRDGLDKKDPASYINWLSDPEMLPKRFPDARIMRYGYNSDWFGGNRVVTSPRIVSKKLLQQLELQRQVYHMQILHLRYRLIFSSHTRHGH